MFLRPPNVAAVFCLFASITRADGQSLTFAKYSADHGVMSSWTYGLAQDSSGYIWVANGGGLQRFDGHDFTFLRSPGPPERRLFGLPVLAVHVDRRGTIWAGTYSAGLARVDPDSELTHFYAPIDGDPTSLSSPVVTSISSGQGSHLWVSTIAGFNRFDPATGTFRRYGDSRAPTVLRTIEDRSGTVWSGTTLGLLRLRPGADRPELITSAPYLASSYIRTIFEDRNGRLWFGTNRGLGSFDVLTGRSRRYELEPGGGPSASILDIQQDPGGDLWIATHGGLFRIDQFGRVLAVYRHDDSDPTSLSADDASTVFIDRSDVVWVGTQTGWINRAEVAKSRFIRLSAIPRRPWSLRHRNVVAVAAGAGEHAWIATPSGLQSFDPHQMRSRDVPLRDPQTGSEVTPTSVREDALGVLWVGTTQGTLLRRSAKGVVRYVLPRSPESTGLPDMISHITEDRTGILWIGTAKGSVRTFDRARGQWGPLFVTPWPAQNFVLGIVRDERGTVWISTTQGGVVRIGRDGTATRLVRDSSWVPTDQIFDATDDPTGRLWLATDRGLVGYDPVADTARTFAMSDGAGNQTPLLSLVRADDGTLWSGTTSGLLRFDPALATFRRFTVSDGLAGNEFGEGVAERLSDGRLVFGGTSGATIVDPNNLHDNPVPPSIVITGISIGDSAVTPVGPVVRTGLRLHFGELVLRISVAALDFRAPELNRLQYRLAGFSDLWREVEGRSLTITHLDPGHYTLQIRGTNNDGLASIQAAALSIEILPPWWQQWWFRLLAAMALVATVVLVIRARVKALVREERLRTKIARDLHDDVSSTLSSILVFAEAIRTDRRRDAGRRRHYLELIAESARSARDMIGDIIWSVDPQHDDWPSFLSKCERFAADLFESAGLAYDLRIQKDVSLDLDLVLRRNLWLIFKEIVTNLVRHASASRAQVVIRSGVGHLLIVVADDGRGFQRERIRHGNGLSNIERRASEIGATVECESRPGGGTTWSVQIRKKR